ncbi:hypothetical protein ACFV7R_43450 [Streptomyces sp. NPDC059866]
MKRALPEADTVKAAIDTVLNDALRQGATVVPLPSRSRTCPPSQP